MTCNNNLILQFGCLMNRTFGFCFGISRFGHLLSEHNRGVVLVGHDTEADLGNITADGLRWWVQSDLVMTQKPNYSDLDSRRCKVPSGTLRVIDRFHVSHGPSSDINDGSLTMLVPPPNGIQKFGRSLPFLVCFTFSINRSGMNLWASL